MSNSLCPLIDDSVLRSCCNPSSHRTEDCDDQQFVDCFNVEDLEGIDCGLASVSQRMVLSPRRYLQIRKAYNSYMGLKALHSA